MVLFVLVFLAAYGGMNGYMFWKLHQAWPQMGRWAAALLLLLAAMTFGPIAVRLLDRAGHFQTASAAAAVAHSWIAIVFWFCCLLLLADGWNLLVWLAARLVPAAGRAHLPYRLVVPAALVLIAVAGAWGIVQAQRIRVQHLTIVTDRLAPGDAPITIAQITDLHLGVDTGHRRLRKVVEILRRERPDVIVSTGDLIDSTLEHIPGMAQALRDVPAPLGKYAVLGNHEYYVGVAASEAFHEAAGFDVLRQEALSVSDRLRIAGVDDPAGARRAAGQSLMNENVVLPENGRRRETFQVLLKHRPTVEPSSLGRFDLQLSGHTHGGQIFPFGFFSALVYPLRSGLHAFADGSRLYVSRGTGTWGPPMRVGAPPEVTMIRLVPASTTR